MFTAVAAVPRTACGRHSINICPKASREMNPSAAAFIELLVGHRVCGKGYKDDSPGPA